MVLLKEPADNLVDLRHSVRIAIFNGTYQKELLTDYSVNISIGGLFVETNMILPVDKEVILKFCLPGSDTAIISKARVAWTNEPGFLKKTSLPPGMGFQFLNLSIEYMRIIRKFLESAEIRAIPKAAHPQGDDSCSTRKLL